MCAMPAADGSNHSAASRPTLHPHRIDEQNIIVLDFSESISSKYIVVNVVENVAYTTTDFCPPPGKAPQN